MTNEWQDREELLTEVLVETMRECGVPSNLHDGLVRYLRQGIRPGGFLQACLANDLRDAILRADPVTIHRLPQVVMFLEHHTPPASWGSRFIIDAWCDTFRCDCIASGNPAKPKQHGADPHAKNCAVYTRRS